MVEEISKSEFMKALCGDEQGPVFLLAASELAESQEYLAESGIESHSPTLRSIAQLNADWCSSPIMRAYVPAEPESNDTAVARTDYGNAL